MFKKFQEGKKRPHKQNTITGKHFLDQANNLTDGGEPNNNTSM